MTNANFAGTESASGLDLGTPSAFDAETMHYAAPHNPELQTTTDEFDEFKEPPRREAARAKLGHCISDMDPDWLLEQGNLGY